MEFTYSVIRFFWKYEKTGHGSCTVDGCNGARMLDNKYGFCASHRHFKSYWSIAASVFDCFCLLLSTGAIAMKSHQIKGFIKELNKLIGKVDEEIGSKIHSIDISAEWIFWLSLIAVLIGVFKTIYDAMEICTKRTNAEERLLSAKYQELNV